MRSEGMGEKAPDQVAMLWGALRQRRRLIVSSFLVIAIVLCMLVAVKPDKYEAHTAFLIRNERADILVSTDPHQNSVQHGDITEEDINSEVELLGSTELLQNVVEACGLYKEFGGRSGAAVEKATRKLSKNIVVTPVRKSAIINVAYTSRNRDGSVQVLNELTRQYLAKHTTLHTAGKAAEFFREKSTTIERQLRTAEDRRAEALQDYGFALLPQERQLSLQQMIDVRRARDDSVASYAETDSRLRQVERQQLSSSPRITTQNRVLANQYSVERLNTMISELENRRTELATKFLPGDPLLVQADKQLADTRTALASAEKIRAQDITTDVNPLRAALDGEADRLRETRAGLVSRRDDLNRQLVHRAAELDRMERASIVINEMDRDIKELEDSLDLYRNKAIAISIAEDLDAAKISNVVVESPPIVPVLPAPSSFNYGTALLLAAFLSLGIGLFPRVPSEKPGSEPAMQSGTGAPYVPSAVGDAHI